MRKPNFFIIGAPKCGTTSLAAWLSEHPQVFMSTPKELDFFNTDIRHGFKDDLVSYEAFFRAAGPDHIAVGEASTGYLRSRAAVPKILEYTGAARFIVCLRNPVEMAISWHRQLLFETWENETDFRKAWALQGKRRQSVAVPSGCTDPRSLLYGEVCELGKQVESLLATVPRSHVLPIILDDMRTEPGAIYRQALSFLGVRDNERTSFPVLNEAKSMPHWLSTLIRHVADTKRKLHFSKGFGILDGLSSRLAQKPSNSIDADTYMELTEYFRTDILRLSSVIDRDLSHWISQKPPANLVRD